MVLKKFSLSTALLVLVGCSFGEQQSPIPAEYAGAAYELSDSNAQKWAFVAKQTEQCIYPNLTRIQYEHFAKEDSYIHSQYVFFYPLEDLIGEDNVKIIQGDQKAMDYATYQFKKYKSKNDVENLDSKQCAVLRTKARDDLAVIKGERKSAMVEVETKEDGTTSTKAATDDNKFFFDIIKWGSALLL
ncbi:hypothetical protein FW755_01490 [Lonepinella koalarum]|uniref:DUF5358 domain-containing protein n=1 Tax=Lonepinella koalarum TaxID=53417 RepID=UPI0011E41249|nr:DUF5358 domain-containing protein [Lonepinella koalarum]TYG33856.1 hypothetical protein FW755_01490 [Lonepinella koalarum]